jgi:hypothetical protein
VGETMEAFPTPEYKNGQTYATVTFMLRAAEAETTGGNLPFSLVPVSVNGTPSGVSEALREGGTVFAGGSGSALDVQEIRHHVVGTYTTGTDLPAWSTALGLNTTANTMIRSTCMCGSTTLPERLCTQKARPV